MKKAQGDDVEVEIVETTKRMLFMQEMNQPKYDKQKDMADLTCLLSPPQQQGAILRAHLREYLSEN